MLSARCRTRRSASSDYNPVMPKRIANGLTLLSAVMCVGSAMLVGRSWLRADSVYVPIGQASVGVAITVDGTVMLLHATSFRAFGFGYASETYDGLWQRLTGIRWLGFGWGSLPVGITVLVLPLWLLPLLTAIPPVRWYRARRREGGRGFAVEGAADLRDAA